MRRRWLGCVFLLVLAPDLGAQISVRANVSPATVGLNRQFVLNLVLSGAQQPDAEPNLPDLDFASFVGSSTSTSIQMTGGRTSMSVIIDYRFQATKLGTFQIPAIGVQVGGREYRTDPVSVTVSAQPPPASAGGAGDDASVSPEDLFVTATPSKRRVYVGEPVVMEYRIFTRVNVDGYNVTKRPSSPGFWVEDLEDPARPVTERVVRDGQEYVTAVIDRIALFPTAAGRRTVEPLTIEAQVRSQRASRDVFDGFFSRGSRIPVLAATDSVELDVRPLPEAGRPADFSGFVGSLGVSASVDRTSGKVDEALTYRIRITGDGNLRTLPDPVLNFPADFEVYPPQVAQSTDRSGGRVSGVKTYEYVLIPRGPGARVIPAVRYSYFDPATSRYATAGADSLNVAITGTATTGPVTAGRDRGAVSTLRQDIRFIRSAMPRFKRRDQSLVGSAAFWLVTLVPLLTLAGAAGVRRHQDRLLGDVAFARGRRAGKVARQRLAKARSLASPDRAKEFHAEVGRALQGFLGDKLNVAEAGMVRDAIIERLAARGVPDEVVREYFGCLDASDRFRFAPAQVTASEMGALLGRAEQAMGNLDQSLRR